MLATLLLVAVLGGGFVARNKLMTMVANDPSLAGRCKRAALSA